ncbi:unnamed protein product [Caenorhabditis auriculariae]|uniref:RING-CH-type domain-containing protein n=1 Tax=Caenorhabditis auriculariae TaxID=2777116 RepID=A0A8S1HQD5_9PELO|nr:unnamed protein product [Caenorhabditis auriculariae]
MIKVMIDLVNQSLGQAVCRICMCSELSVPYLGNSVGEPLISPCNCKGTMGLYHRSCLEHWLSTSRTTRCEICKFQFELGRKLRSFYSYLKLYGMKRRKGERGFAVEAVYMLILTVFIVAVLAFCIACIVDAWRRYESVPIDLEINEDYIPADQARNRACLEIVTFGVIALFLFLIYFALMSATIGNRYHYFKVWQRKNAVVFVVDRLDAERSMHYNGRHIEAPRGLTRKVQNAWNSIRSGGEGSPVRYPEVQLIEPVLGINPQLIAAFNQTAADSENTHNDDTARNAMPFAVSRPSEQIVRLETFSSPRGNFYGEPFRSTAASPPQMPEDLFADVDLASPESFLAPRHGKSPSVHSVTSFHAGVGSRMCSTPRHDAFTRIVPQGRNFNVCYSNSNRVVEDSAAQEPQRPS